MFLLYNFLFTIFYHIFRNVIIKFHKNIYYKILPVYNPTPDQRFQPLPKNSKIEWENLQARHCARVSSTETPRLLFLWSEITKHSSAVAKYRAPWVFAGDEIYKDNNHTIRHH